ncbi:MAG: hypothetical protein EKK55_19275 [Rhodocyclaceae bacterium]|nr:MAG: hypothetical protein EKK55_19275 [Rhodocyclaceae bacterium]
MSYELELADVTFDRLRARVVARTGLSRIEADSEVGQILAAFAREIEIRNLRIAQVLDLVNLDRLVGADLDAFAALVLPDGLARRGAARATGAARFTRATATSSAVSIPAGTRIARVVGSSTVVYVTTDAGEIPADETDSVRTGEGGDIPIRAEVAGIGGNAPAGTITKVLGTIAGINAVTNPAVVTGGLNAEPDGAFRERIRSHTRSLARCTPGALESLVLGAVADDGKIIAFARSVIDLDRPGRATMLVDDGAGTGRSVEEVDAEDLITSAVGGERRLFFSRRPLVASPTILMDVAGGDDGVELVEGVDYHLVRPWGMVELTLAEFPDGLASGDRVYVDEAYEVFTGIVAVAQRLIDGDANDPVTFPVWRAEGTIITVDVPVVVWVNITATLVIEGSRAAADVRADVASAWTAYVNGLGSGEEVILTELIGIATAVDGVFDLVIEAPADNVIVGDYSVARVNTVAVS